MPNLRRFASKRIADGRQKKKANDASPRDSQGNMKGRKFPPGPETVRERSSELKKAGIHVDHLYFKTDGTKMGIGESAKK